MEFYKKILRVQHDLPAAGILQHPAGEADIIVFFQLGTHGVAGAGAAGAFQAAFFGPDAADADAGLWESRHLFGVVDNGAAAAAEFGFFNFLVAFGADDNHVGAFHQLDGFALFSAEFYFVHVGIGFIDWIILTSEKW